MPGLQKVAAALVAPGKGILAADASIATMSRRLAATRVLAAAFGELDAMGVDPRGIVLKPSMIVSGVGHEEEHGCACYVADTDGHRTTSSSGNRVPVRKTVQ